MDFALELRRVPEQVDLQLGLVLFHQVEELFVQQQQQLQLTRQHVDLLDSAKEL